MSLYDAEVGFSSSVMGFINNQEPHGIDGLPPDEGLHARDLDGESGVVLGYPCLNDAVPNPVILSKTLRCLPNKFRAVRKPKAPFSLVNCQFDEMTANGRLSRPCRGNEKDSRLSKPILTLKFIYCLDLVRAQAEAKVDDGICGGTLHIRPLC